MTWTDYKYFSTWVDPQGRTHRVELYPDNYTAGSQTEYDAGVRPLTYNFGSPTDDEFRPLNPTDVSAEMVVPDETLFDDIAGDGDQTWGLMWKISGTEVWRGFVLPDQLVQAVESVDTTLVVNAVCGLVYVEDTDWTPAAGARDTLVAIGADALGQVGHGLQIGAAADWHASGQSGNSYGVYKTDEYALKDTENERQDGKYASPAVFLQQIAGRFAGKLFQARGKWRLIQREEVTGSSYAQDVYNSSGVDTAANETVSRVEIDTSTNPKYPGTTKRIARRYEKAVVRYAHGPLGNSMFQNRSFEYWSGTPSLPESWTEWSDESGDEGAPDVGQNPSTIVSRDTAHQALTWNFWNSQGSGNSPGTAIESNSAALIPAISGTGVAKALVGIKQDASGSVAASQGLIFSVDARLKLDGAIGSESVDARPFWVSIWIDGDAGTDYYFDGNPASANYQTWVSGTMATPPDAAKIQLNAGYLDRSWFRFEIDASLDGAITFPDAGTLRVILYNVVETDSGTALEGILYDNVDVTIVGSSQESDGVTYTVSTGGSGSGTHDGGTWFWGQGPTSSHPGRLTHGAGTYSSAWSSSGGAEAASLDKLHADRLLKAKENANTVLSTSFRMGSGTYWPDQALLYDSDEYTCVHLEYDAGRDEYQGTFVTTGVSSLSPGDETASSQQLLYAPDAEGALFGLLNAETVPPKGDGLQYRVGLDSIPDGQEFLKWNIDGAPPGSTNVSGSGLYVGTDKMGYYSGSKWTTYMDSSGNLKLVDSDGGKTFLVYVDDGATEQLSFSIEAATALGGFVILNSEDAKQMQILAEDAKITLFGSNSSTTPGEPWIGFDGDLMADSSGHTIGGGPGGDSWAGLYISGLGEFTVTAGGEATAEGVTLRNTTAATVSVDQFSPALRWEGRGWETTTGTSDAVVFQSYVETIKGTAAAGTWHLQASLNGGAYSDVLTVTSGGVIGGATWQGTVIASAYLDTDTAHLSETQTFSGAKTFGLGTTFTGAIVVNGGIQSDLIPTTDSTRDLGSATYRWAQVHTDDLYVAGDTKTDLIPDVTNTLDLGSASKQWQDVYAVNGVFASNLTLGGTDVSLSGHTHTASEITDLATAATGITKVGTIATGTWQGTAIASAYLDADTAHLSGTQTFTGAKSFSADVTVSADFDPGGSALYDHGTAALRWRTGYFVNIDASTDVATGTVTVATDVVHAGDTNTKISFTSDNIQLEAGGVIMLDLDEGATDKATFGADVYIPEYLYHDGDTDTYLQFGTNTLTLSAGANAAFSLTSSNIGITTSMSARTITPQTDDTYDLGSATYYWNNCFLTNVDVDTLSAKDGSTIVVNANLSDDIGGLYSLGASGTRWLKTWTGALDANGTVTFGGLPTSSGGAAGTLWNDSGTIKIN